MNLKLKLCYDRRSVGQSASLTWYRIPLWGPCLLLPDICGFLDVLCPLWREDESIVYNCCRNSLAQSLSVPSPAGTMTIFSVSKLRLHQLGWPGPRINIPWEQSGTIIHRGTGFFFHHLYRLARMRRRCFYPPLHGVMHGASSLSFYTVTHTPVDMLWPWKKKRGNDFVNKQQYPSHR
jgi:hypothetical protein